MSEYIAIVLWLAVMALFQRFVDVEETISVHGKKKKRVTWWYAILVFVPLMWFTVNRDKAIGDTFVYIQSYKKSPKSFSLLFPYYQSLSKDRWYYFVEAFIHTLFASDNYKIFFFVVAAFQVFALIVLYRKYSGDYLLAAFIFVTCGDYISWMLNGIRQFVAVCICLLTTSWMIDRKYIPSIIVILIASRFHGSALLMIPIFLICVGEPWNRRTILMLAIVLISIVFVSQFTTWLDAALDDTQYTNVVTDWQSWNDDGTNPIRVLIYSAPTILSLMGLHYIRETDDVVINFCTNMSIVTFGLYLISMVTSGIFIGRLPIYASLYSNGILLPWELNHIFNKDSSRYMKMAAIAGFLLLYIYQIHFEWRII